MKEKLENRAIRNAQAAIASKVYIPKRSRDKVAVTVIDGRLTLIQKKR